VTDVLDFLQQLADKPLALSTVLGYLTAVSNRHVKLKVKGGVLTNLSQLSTVQTWVRGLKLKMQTDRTVVPKWNLEIVLAALKRPPYYPLNTATLKHLTQRTVFLVAITSARRASEIHALRSDTLQFSSTSVTAHVDPSFLPKVASDWHCTQPLELPAMHEETDVELRKLCVRATLNAYLNATQAMRTSTDSKQLFLCYGSYKKGAPVSKQRISSWLKEVVRDAYKLSGLPPPQGVKGHQVRSQAASWAEAAGVDPQKICDAATWRTGNMFAKHYRLDLHHAGRSEFGRRVLALSASSTAASSVRRNLKSVSLPPRRQ